MDWINTRPCPFCGSEDTDNTRRTKTKVNSYAVKCVTCGATGPYREHTSEAAEVWNKRVAPGIVQSDVKLKK